MLGRFGVRYMTYSDMFGMFDQCSKCSVNVRNVRSHVREMFRMFNQCSINVLMLDLFGVHMFGTFKKSLASLGSV